MQCFVKACIGGIYMWGAMAGYAHANSYAVVINQELRVNKQDVIPMLRNLYLYKRTEWPDGTKAVPIGRPAGSDEQHAFLKYILQMSNDRLQFYWQREKQDVVPPKAIGSTRFVLRQISRKKGAFSIIALRKNVMIPPNVKVIHHFTVD